MTRGFNDLGMRAWVKNLYGDCSVPRFHFNIFDEVESRDTIGSILADLDTARSNAIEGARDLICEQVREGRPVYQSHRVEITDTSGALLHTVTFGDLIDLRP